GVSAPAPAGRRTRRGPFPHRPSARAGAVLPGPGRAPGRDAPDGLCPPRRTVRALALQPRGRRGDRHLGRRAHRDRGRARAGAPLRTGGGAAPDDVVVLLLGALERRKGHAVLLAAGERLAAENVSLRY